MDERIDEKINVMNVSQETVDFILDEVRGKNFNDGYMSGYIRGNKKGYASGFGGGLAFAGSLLVVGIGLVLAGGYLVDKMEKAMDKEDTANGSESV